MCQALRPVSSQLQLHCLHLDRSSTAEDPFLPACPTCPRLHNYRIVCVVRFCQASVRCAPLPLNGIGDPTPQMLTAVRATFLHRNKLYNAARREVTFFWIASESDFPKPSQMLLKPSLTSTGCWTWKSQPPTHLHLENSPPKLLTCTFPSSQRTLTLVRGSRPRRLSV